MNMYETRNIIYLHVFLYFALKNPNNKHSLSYSTMPLIFYPDSFFYYIIYFIYIYIYIFFVWLIILGLAVSPKTLQWRSQLKNTQQHQHHLHIARMLIDIPLCKRFINCPLSQQLAFAESPAPPNTERLES